MGLIGKISKFFSFTLLIVVYQKSFSQATWAKIINSSYQTGINRIMKLNSDKYLLLNYFAPVGAYPPGILKFNLLNTSFSIDTSFVLEPGFCTNVSWGEFNYISDSSLIAFNGWHVDGVCSKTFLYIIDTLGYPRKLFTHPSNTSSITEPIPVSSDKFFLIGGVGSAGNATVELMLLDTNGVCNRLWEFSMPYSYRTVRHIFVSDSLFLTMFKASSYSPFGSNAFGFAVIDTTSMQSVTYWYRHPTSSLCPTGMIQVSNNLWLIFGNNDGSCFYAGNPTVVAVRRDGSQVWARTIYGINGMPIASIKKSSNGIILYGTSSLSLFGGQDLFMLELDTLGNLINAVIIGTADEESPGGLLQLDDGTFLVGASSVISNIRKPVLLKLDSVLNIPCAGYYSKNITHSLNVDTTFLLDTMVVFSLSLQTCVNLQTTTFTSLSTTDSLYYVWDSVSVIVDTTINPICSGDSGLAVVSASGGVSPYVFHWSNGIIDTGNVDSQMLIPGSYQVYVNDLSGCISQMQAVYISSPPPISISIDSIDPILCFGDSTGAIYTSITGGTPPYMPVWNTNDTSTYIDSLSAGTYIITVYDSLDCQETDSVVISEPPLLDVYIDSNQIPTLIAVSSGGMPPYLYTWNTGSVDSVITVNQTGTYWVVITDQNGCQASDTIYVVIIGISSPYGESCTLNRDGNLLTVRCNKAYQEIKVMSIDGRVVASCYNSHSCSVNLSNPSNLIILRTNNRKHFKMIRVGR